jgi:hypothetical protein
MGVTLGAILLLVSVVTGLNAGVTADSKAEIRGSFDEVRNTEIDSQSQSEWDNPAVPNNIEHRLDDLDRAIPQLYPDWVYRAVEGGTERFAETLIILVAGVGEAVALFAFNHQSIVGHSAFVALINGITQLSMLALVGWNLFGVIGNSGVLRGEI